MRLLVLILLVPILGCAKDNPRAPVYEIVEVRYFCYRTLADIACYDRPDVGRGRQYVGSYTRDTELIPHEFGTPD